MQREIKISSQLHHPHIIKIYETMETADDIYVVLEYAPSGELFDYITERGKLPESDARAFFQQLISGIDCCHRKMVAHRDIKPENILLDKKNRIKIADFGLSNAMREGHFLKTSCGSPQYAAPEIVSGAMAGPSLLWSSVIIGLKGPDISIPSSRNMPVEMCLQSFQLANGLTGRDVAEIHDKQLRCQVGFVPFNLSYHWGICSEGM